MYFGIFVLAACAMFGFVHSNEECPWCESYESLEDCDKNIEAEPEVCLSANNARCFLKKEDYTDDTYYMRGCMDEETAKETSQECTGRQERRLPVCKSSGNIPCKAVYITDIYNNSSYYMSTGPRAF
ncbi:hypothetical protein OS493_036899 [Desmophyllum pertusum]|uniref:Sodefrin-like factor n=1 Tax=Desmophyllum pertusum TaxID=174260 RepID=A0A9W9YHY8_9CNID|nr:hypothetical protein OS493_036899 [Desmophyllum pertusum]